MQIEQPDRVRHRGAAPADLDGDILLAHAELAGQARIPLSFFNRVEIGPLKVLDQRDFKHFQIGRVTNDHRDLGQPGFLGRPPAPLAGDEFVASVGRTDDKRLNDAVLPNRIHQFLQGIAGKFFPRLKRARCDAGETDLPDFFV